MLIADGADDCKDWPRHWLAHSVYRNVLSKPSLINPPKMLVWPGLPISSIKSHTPLDEEEPWMDINLCICVTRARTITTPSLIPYFPAFRAMAITSVAFVIMSSCLQDVFLASSQISESARTFLLSWLRYMYIAYPTYA